MGVDVSVKEAYSGVSASNAVGRANPGILSDHPGEYVFQKFFEIADKAGIQINEKNCFSASVVPKTYSDAIANGNLEVQEREFKNYSNLYSAAIQKLLQTISASANDYLDFQCEMFNELHDDVQFRRVCSFLVASSEDRNLFEADLCEFDDWLFHGTELEPKKVQHNSDSADVYLVNGASPACDAYKVYLDGAELYHLADHWGMSSIERGLWAVCNKEKNNQDNPDKQHVVKLENGQYHGDFTSYAQYTGTFAECSVWVGANQAPSGARYEVIECYEVMKEQKIRIPEEYHPSLILDKLEHISNCVRSLYLAKVLFQLKDWLTFGPPTGGGMMMAGSGDSRPKTAPNLKKYYKVSGSKQFVCKLRPGRWSNELNTLLKAIGELPSGYDLAILLWSHSVNQDFTDLIHNLIRTKGDVKRMAGIVHYDNKGTYVSEHSYKAKGWKFEEQNDDHKGTIEGFNSKV